MSHSFNCGFMRVCFGIFVLIRDIDHFETMYYWLYYNYSKNHYCGGVVFFFLLLLILILLSLTIFIVAIMFAFYHYQLTIAYFLIPVPLFTTYSFCTSCILVRGCFINARQINYCMWKSPWITIWARPKYRTLKQLKFMKMHTFYLKWDSVFSIF